MPQLSFVTTVGSTADVRASRADVILVSEPDTGATLRTKGRLYLLFECAPPGPAEKIAREVGELADFVHRTTTREAASLGVDADVLPKVWRQSIEAGDTVILASAALVDGLGAEALKNAAVTLHPRSAAEHIHNRAVADGVTGSDAV